MLFECVAFAREVCAALAAVPEKTETALFYRFWTLGEAYIKATGLGVSQGLKTFAFAADDPPRLSRATPGWGPPERWRFGAMKARRRWTRSRRRTCNGSSSGCTTVRRRRSTNILTVLNVLLKTAVSWDLIERMPSTIRLLPVPISPASFLDFEEYELAIEKAIEDEPQAYLTALLGGEADLRCGEMLALEWADVNLTKRQSCVQRSDWKGHVTVPKGGRLRYVPLTARLAAALRAHKHPAWQAGAVSAGRVGTHAAGSRRLRSSGDAAGGAPRLRTARPASHVLLAPGHARGARAGDQALAGHRRLSTTLRSMHLSPAGI